MFSLIIKPQGSTKWEEHLVVAKSIDSAIKKLEKQLKTTFELVGYQDLRPRG